MQTNLSFNSDSTPKYEGSFIYSVIFFLVLLFAVVTNVGVTLHLPGYFMAASVLRNKFPESAYLAHLLTPYVPKISAVTYLPSSTTLCFTYIRDSPWESTPYTCSLKLVPEGLDN